jgi:RimJ/RimL family protein N-acetyltransferase
VAFAELNADPQVMRYFPATLTRTQSDALAARIGGSLARRGWGLWAVEARDDPFIGFVGLSPVPAELPCAPAVEIGWRLARAHWGRGYATEAARVVVNVAFEDLGLAGIVSYTAQINEPSRRVMERLGMSHSTADDFDHPAVEGPLRRHVLYRLRAPAGGASAVSSV